MTMSDEQKRNAEKKKYDENEMQKKPGRYSIPTNWSPHLPPVPRRVDRGTRVSVSETEWMPRQPAALANAAIAVGVPFANSCRLGCLDAHRHRHLAMARHTLTHIGRNT
jgi:hypothetical protein